MSSQGQACDSDFNPALRRCDTSPGWSYCRHEGLASGAGCTSFPSLAVAFANPRRSGSGRCQTAPPIHGEWHEFHPWVKSVNQASSSSPASSSGVQMIGCSYPASRQTASMRPRKVALAMCLKFQVAKYSTPCTAAIAICNASRGSDAGTAPEVVS